MVTDFPQTLRQELIKLLVPHMTTEAERRAILVVAVPRAAYGQISFGGPPDVFTANMLTTLQNYGQDDSGKHTIVAILDVVHQRVGSDKKREIEQLQQKIQDYFQVASQPSLIQCTNCKVLNRNSARYCRNCGELLNSLSLFRRQWDISIKIVISLVTGIVCIILIWVGVKFTDGFTIPGVPEPTHTPTATVTTLAPPTSTASEPATPVASIDTAVSPPTTSTPPTETPTTIPVSPSSAGPWCGQSRDMKICVNGVETFPQGGGLRQVRFDTTVENQTNGQVNLQLFGGFIARGSNGRAYEADPFGSDWATHFPAHQSLTGSIDLEEPLPTTVSNMTLIFSPLGLSSVTIADIPIP